MVNEFKEIIFKIQWKKHVWTKFNLKLTKLVLYLDIKKNKKNKWEEIYGSQTNNK